MLIEQIWTGNSYRNFNYLVACPDTHEALAIDPLDHAKCLAVAKEKGWTIKAVVNTHEHGDHIAGNRPIIEATGATLLAHHNAGDSITGVDVYLREGDSVNVGSSVELTVLDTPGHTMTHVCLLSKTDVPALFCGDTLFNAGVGNCHNGGHPEALFYTFSQQLALLDDQTRIYPGHEYIAHNLAFTLSKEPDNQHAKSLLEQVKDQDPNDAFITTLAIEKQVNAFFRLSNPTIIAMLQHEDPDFPKDPDPKTVFLKLRALRNAW